MTTNRLRPMALRFALGSVLGAALLAGTSYGDASAKGAKTEAVQLKRSDEKAIVRSEEAVAKSPQDAALRAALGQDYLRAGRFASATGAFVDAVALGDTSARTALGLALANIARGQNRAALGTLENAHGIPASDMGLAIALAGDTGRGVAILSDALRGGDDTPKLRQNLAYAYALNGNWREARVMMSQDVPAEQLDGRMTQWVASGHPDYYHQRVAALLGAPVRTDSGVPAYLALNAAPAAQQAVAEVPAAAPAPVAELPPVEQVAAAPQPAPLADFAPALSAPAASTLSAPVETGHSLASFAEFARPVSSTLQAAPAPRVVPARAPRAAIQPTSGGSHVVQLGSFTTEQSARRAWSVFVSRNPELKTSRMVITPAVVNGRNFWRVAAASYSRPSAQGLCSSVKARGGACFAYATSGPRQNMAMMRTEFRSTSLALARR